MLNSAKYTIRREKYFCFLLGHSNSCELNGTITSKVVLYAPAERADTLLLFLLYTFLLCGFTNQLVHGRAISCVSKSTK